MTFTRRPAGWLMASLLAVSLVGGCGGSDEPPLVQPTSDAPSAAPTDADGSTAAQREVITAMEAYDVVFFGRGTTPLRQVAGGIMTDDLLATLEPVAAQTLEDGTRQYSGTTTIKPTSVTIDGDTAVFAGCRDASQLFIVPVGQKAGQPGTRLVGSTQLEYGFVRQAGQWLVNDPKGTAVDAC